jgi:predicted pyridoxine 5'-phosphate oxidase superfamily flavin-nucleotide-binding protein
MRPSRKALVASFESEISEDLAAFVGAQTSAFLATADAEGQPYVQHRGGPPGFLHVLDAHTIAFADLRGNRQFFSLQNLAENPKAMLFLVDFAHRQRVKLWATARAVTDEALVKRLTPPGERADQAIALTVTAWSANCPKNIPQLIDAEAVRAALDVRDRRIAELEAKLRRAAG